MLRGASVLGKLLVLRRCLLTPCLQPQMKTYRCPWCVSRTNHNILYFVNISRTSSLNPAICLWKLRISLAGRGFERSNLHRIWGITRARSGPQSNRSNPCLNPSPGQPPAQDAEPVHFACISVQVVDIWAEPALSRHQASKRGLAGKIRWCRTRAISIPSVVGT